MAITQLQKLAQYSEQIGLGPLWIRCDQPVLREAMPCHQTPKPKVDSTSFKTAKPLPTKTLPKTSVSTTDSETHHLPINPTHNAMPLDQNNLPDWETLQEQVKVCKACVLAKTRLHTVFGRGSVTAQWLLIGEAPGRNEDEQGLAFVGQAGRLLDNMLSAIGLDSNTDVFMTNVLKCRPPANRNPAEDEMLACEHFLQAQIAKIKPKLIIALGRFAVQALLNTKQSIGSLRGITHDYQGTPLIVTFHPAYLLRNLPEKAKAWQDFLLARNTTPLN